MNWGREKIRGKARRGGGKDANNYFVIFAVIFGLTAWFFAVAPVRAEVTAPVPPPPQGATAPAAPGLEPQAPAPLEAGTAPQIPNLQVSPSPGAASSETMGITYPPEYVTLIQKTTAALMSANFTFYPIKALDPFVPFITPETQVRAEGDEEAKSDERPLTPLQKMTLSEIERGLKAITWGDLGRRAVIEDSTGKGYIVTVGTPAGEHSGVIIQIYNDRLVIQQEIWDRKTKKRFPQDFIVKLSKRTGK